MKRRGIKLLVAVLIGWCVAAPLIELADSWVGPKVEIFDIARCVGASAAIAAAGLAIGTLLVRTLAKRQSSKARAYVRRLIHSRGVESESFLAVRPRIPHPPPLSPLRV